MHKIDSGMLKSFNPKSQEMIGELPITPVNQISEVVEASKNAQAAWAELSIDERVRRLEKAYAKIIEQKEAFAQLIHDEMGKTLAEATAEVEVYTSKISSLGEEMKKALAPEVNDDGATVTTTYFDPLGVSASITPWNFPLGMPHNLMIPSLMAGNTVLFKPSEEVSLVGKAYFDILNEYLPSNVIQIVIGDGAQGKALVESDVQLITFTGSQETGKKILSAAGGGLKRVILELGGKDPLIVLEDADLDAAADFAARNSFRNAGQVCVSTEMILLPKGKKDEFVKKLKDRTNDVKIGTMIHEIQKNHVIKQIDNAIADGAKLEMGDPKASSGNELSPVILSGVTPEMNIMKDETFGPVACITEVDSDDEAVQIANSSRYALGAVVFGKKNAQAIGRRLKAGMVGINRGVGGAAGSPWVGANQSGYGFHGSTAGHRQFTQLRIVSEPK